MKVNEWRRWNPWAWNSLEFTFSISGVRWAELFESSAKWWMTLLPKLFHWLQEQHFHVVARAVSCYGTAREMYLNPKFKKHTQASPSQSTAHRNWRCLLCRFAFAFDFKISSMFRSKIIRKYFLYWQCVWWCYDVCKINNR